MVALVGKQERIPKRWRATALHDAGAFAKCLAITKRVRRYDPSFQNADRYRTSQRLLLINAHPRGGQVEPDNIGSHQVKVLTAPAAVLDDVITILHPAAAGL